MQKLLSLLSQLLLIVFFPPVCVVCKKFGHLLCAECLSTCSFYNRQCALDLQITKLPVIATTYLNTESTRIISAFKYSHIHGLGQYIAQAMFEHTTLPSIDLVTFVPLHAEKRARRGFNQAECIATALAKHLAVPCCALLERGAPAAVQASLKHKNERMKNTKQLFSLLPQAENRDKALRVLLIDDICTTGATLGACHTVLKKHGFTEVYGAVFAHGQ